MSSARTLGHAFSLTDGVTILAAPQRVLHLVCILDVVSSTTLLVTLAGASMLAKPLSGTVLALPRMGWGSSRRLPVCGSGQGLVWSLHHGTAFGSFGEPPFVARHLHTNFRPARGSPFVVARTGRHTCLLAAASLHSCPPPQFALRTPPPRWTRGFAHAHDARVAHSLERVVACGGAVPCLARTCSVDAPLVNSLAQILLGFDAPAEAGFAVPRRAGLPQHGRPCTRH